MPFFRLGHTQCVDVEDSYAIAIVAGTETTLYRGFDRPGSFVTQV